MKKITATKVKKTGPAKPMHSKEADTNPLLKSFGKVKPLTKKNDGSFKVAPVAGFRRPSTCC